MSVWPANGSPGGDSPPAWARAGSVADIDFVNNPPRAWTSTGGEVAFADFDTILGDSALLNVTYDPNNFVLGSGWGLGDPEAPAGFNFIGDMLNAFDTDFSCIAEFDDRWSMEFTEDTFSTDVVAQSAPNPSHAFVGDQNSGDSLYQNPDIGATVGAHKMCFTITAETCYAAMDGASLVFTGGPTTTISLGYTVPPTDIVTNAQRLKRLTVYNPIKTEAEQRTLTA